MNRDQKLKLLQRAYSEWIRRFPEENDDDIGSHLLEIQIACGLPADVITGLGSINTTYMLN